MTAPQIIQQIEAAGGILAVNGDRIRYELPEQAAPWVDTLRQHRDEVLRVLQVRRDTATRQVSRWLGARCLRSQRAWAAEKFLYRDYLAWCGCYRQAPCPRRLFGDVLSESFQRDEEGWQGVCLAEDFISLTTGRMQ